MDLRTYLQKLNERPSNWAKKHGIDPATLSRFFAGKQTFKLETAKKIVAATQGAVSYEDLSLNLLSLKSGERRLAMAEEQLAAEQAAILGPSIDKLLAMLGAARDAYNRHSRASLQELQDLAGAVAQDFTTLARQVEALVSRPEERERQSFIRLFSILSRLEVIGQNLGGLTSPIGKKIKDGVLFSDKAVTQTNYLFDQHAGMIRSILDIVKTDNAFLKKYVLEESRKLVQACADFATEHEERLIEGLCLPQAAPIFLAILDRFRTIGEHEMEVATQLTRKS